MPVVLDADAMTSEAPLALTLTPPLWPLWLTN